MIVFVLFARNVKIFAPIYEGTCICDFWLFAISPTNYNFTLSKTEAEVKNAAMGGS